MGFFFGGTAKPHISKLEFAKIRSRLISKKISPQKVDKIEGVFYGDLVETGTLQKGIDKEEVERGLAWLRAHRDDLHLTESEINDVDATMKEFL